MLPNTYIPSIWPGVYLAKSFSIVTMACSHPFCDQDSCKIMPSRCMAMIDSVAEKFESSVRSTLLL